VPEAAEVLHTLQKQNHHCAIVTSAWRKLAEIRIIAAGLPVPKVIVPVDEIRNGKPEGSLRAAEKLGVAPEDADSHLPGDQQGEEKEKRTEPDGIRFRSISLDGSEWQTCLTVDPVVSRRTVPPIRRWRKTSS
jgi:hypothetical protein